MARKKSAASDLSTKPGSGSSRKAGAGSSRKAGSDPSRKSGKVAQIRQIFTVTRKNDPAVVWWMLLAAVVTLAVMTGIGFAIGHPLYLGILGIPLALMAALLVMSRRAERAAYRSIEGQPGAAGAALSALRRGWYYDQEPVAAEASSRARGARDLTAAAMIFRATGRPGVVLIAEGPRGSATKLAESERKKVARVAGPNVPVTVLRVGTDEDAVPVNKVTGRMQKLKPVLTKDEASAVNKRLKALGGVRPAVPAGVDPTRARMDRKGLRGR